MVACEADVRGKRGERNRYVKRESRRILTYVVLGSPANMYSPLTAPHVCWSINQFMSQFIQIRGQQRLACQTLGHPLAGLRSCQHLYAADSLLPTQTLEYRNIDIKGRSELADSLGLLGLARLSLPAQWIVSSATERHAQGVPTTSPHCTVQKRPRRLGKRR